MKLLVTGGAGYIGSVVSAQLVEDGHGVVVFDNLVKGHREAVPSKAEFVQGDVGDRSMLDRVFHEHRIDAVLHFAAWIEAGESMQSPERFFKNNTANSLTLLEAMHAHGVKKLVFSSTAALFGNPARTPIVEDDALQPTNAYGESKLLVERMLAWFHQIHNFSFASLRYFNAAGATPMLGESHSPETHLIPLILQVAQGKRANISIFGTDYETNDGSCVRDYVHVSDLASAHVLALEALSSKPNSQKLYFNLGNGRGFSVREVIEAARKVTGHAIPAVEAARREGDPAVLVASSEKIQRELGWKPKHGELEDIIRSAWNWMQQKPNGYGSAK
jgi:UDP-glucose 4-epimerase